jgi:hypothetical protein
MTASPGGLNSILPALRWMPTTIRPYRWRTLTSMIERPAS